ncbi:MAG: tetratricopeptide repeat protein [Sulfurimonas sp.]|nr:tetratricopeptide repeat protein [Sulfurimonas sp.]
MKEVLAMLLAHIYFNKNDFKNAKIYYLLELKYITTKKDKLKRINKIANQYFEKESYTTSAFWYQKAFEYGDENVLYNLAYSYQKRKKYTKAIRIYKMILKNNNDTSSMNNLSIIYRNIGNQPISDYWYKKSQRVK